MNLHDALNRLKDIQPLLSGITKDNALEYVGKGSEKLTQRMIKNDEEPVNTGFHGTALAKGLDEANTKLQRYNQAHRDVAHEDPSVAAQVQSTTVALSEDLARKKIAHRLAQCVVLTGSLELPDVGFREIDGDRHSSMVPLWDKSIDIGNNIKRRVLDAPSGTRLYWIKAWADSVYEKAVVIRGEPVGV